MSHKRNISLLALVGVVSGMLFVGGPAQAQTTYEIQTFQDFFDRGVPGFSARFYPGSVKVHSGDTLIFTQGSGGFTAPGQYPQSVMGEEDIQVGDPSDASFTQALLFDPDDGENALKGNLNSFLFQPGDADCGSADNPCVWGTNSEPFFPVFNEDDPALHVTVDAPPGTTLWAANITSPDVNVNFKVEVVDEAEAASTQESLDARAARLQAKDFEDALALHNKMNDKQTSHRDAAGRKVFDVWVGAAAGPIELLASYPRRTAIREGQRVQFHFMDQVEPHTATFGGPNAREVLLDFFLPMCDPDGDAGAGPDTEATFDPEAGDIPFTCSEGELEADVHDLAPFEVGNGRVKNNRDYENSGLQFPQFPEETAFDENPDPWTVGFPNASNRKGFKYICLIHGGFMGGRVRVR